MSEQPNRAPMPVLVGIGLIGAAVMVLQISVTRLLSSTVSYHAAFIVIALVMLGLAASATSVFLHRQAASPATISDASTRLQQAALACGIGMVAFAAVGLLPAVRFTEPLQMLASLGLFFGIFWLTGWAVAFLLAEYHEDVGRVYWSDLTGAAVGCLFAVPLLDLTSAMNVIVLCGVGFAGAGLLLARLADGQTQSRSGMILGAMTLLIVAALVYPPITSLKSARGQDQSRVRWYTWNHLARVTVVDNIPGVADALDYLEKAPQKAGKNVRQLVNRWQMGWGMSDSYKGEAPEILWVQLDADAGTQIIKDGANRVDDLTFLAADITSSAHQLKRDQIDRAFVIGGGGGRDILTALHFGAKKVRVVELNPAVVQAVDEVYRDYSGGTYSLPQVDLTVGEARSVLSRETDRFDIIQMSMIDTWASSMAGSMVLTENGLYTAEAFALYIDRLSDDGMLSISRWYHPVRWGELARVVTLATEALQDVGVDDPSNHVAVLYASGTYDLNVGTVIVKRSPFTDAELTQLSSWTGEMGFKMLWPRDASLPDEIEVGTLLAGNFAGSVYDLYPPTDDRPFFFNVDRPFASWLRAAQEGNSNLGSKSSAMILTLLLLLMVASRIIVISPLQEYEASKPEAERVRLSDHVRPFAYFAGIGLGFMWIELAVIQRYITYLGHPTYALSVVLFSLLLFGGLGSGLSKRVGWKSAVGVIMVGVLITAFAVPLVTAASYGMSKMVRIVLSVVLIAPLGLVMGMMYPEGVRLLEKHGVAELVPWVWAVNGVAGVFASVAGMFIAIQFGYTALLLLGAAAYGMTAWAASGPFTPAK